MRGHVRQPRGGLLPRLLMPAIAATLMIAGLAVLPQPRRTANAATDPALAAHYTLDEGSGTTAGDSSGGGHAGTLTGGPAWTAGMVGPHALAFGGSGAYIDIPEPVVDTSRSFSVSAWVKLTTLNGFNTAVSIDGNEVSTFYLQLRDDTHSFAFTRLPADDVAANGRRAQASATFTPKTGTWYQLVGVYDAAAHQIALYVNGELQQRVPYSGGWKADGHTLIGRGEYDGNPVDFFHGSIDDVRFYAGALDAGDIRGFATAAHYPFDEGDGATAGDATGNGYDGTLRGGASWGSGIVGSHAVALDGETGHVDVPDPVLNTKASFSVATWVRLAATDGVRTAVSVDGDRVSAFALQLRGDSHTFAFTRTSADTDGAAGDPTYAAAHYRPTTGRWYHLVGVYDAAADQIALYVDGRLVRSTAFTSPWRAGGHLEIGRGELGGDPVDFLAGRVDDTRIYRYALSADKVRALTAAGSWHFDEGSGTTAADSSPNGNDGDVHGASWTSGAVHGALAFDGVDDFVSMGDASALDFGGGSFSVGGWFQTADDGAQRIASKGDIDGSDGYHLDASAPGAPGHVGVGVGAGGTPAGSLSFHTAKTFDDRSWHYAAVVVDRDAATATLYVDGEAQPVATDDGTCGTTSGTTVDLSACPRLDASSDADFTVGSAGGVGRYAEGKLDEIRVFPYALTAAQVRGIAQLTTLTVHADQPGPQISPTLYGIFFEEINYAGDGGLYAELLRNQAMMESSTEPAHWSLVQDGDARGSMLLDTREPLNDTLTRSLRLQVDSLGPGGRVGVANGGYFGIPVRPGATYHASFFAKASRGFHGPLTVTLESSDGSTVYAQGTVAKLSRRWGRHSVRLTARNLDGPTTDARFVVAVADRCAGNRGHHCGPPHVRPKSRVWLDVVSLVPDSARGDGPFRADLMDKLQGLAPGFLRFPGGNYLEGSTLDTHWAWKDTIGPISRRPGHANSAWGYWSDDGLGLLEYLALSEDLHATPVMGIWAGYALNGTHVPRDGFDSVVQDALDQIEFAIGPTTSKWGALRAEYGHPKPFDLTYVEIGNESYFDPTGSYEWRYAALYDAIKQRYPQLKIIASARVNSRPMDVLDEHFYSSPQFFVDNDHRYDSYPRSGPKIFVGEYAVTSEGNPTGTLAGAVGEAAFMTGLERNADLVQMASYAPLFVNVHGQQWSTNLIGFDGLRSFGSPSYYVQRMFSRNTGDVVLPTKADDTPLAYVTSKDEETGTTFVKVVNPTDSTQVSRITVEGGPPVGSSGSAVVLTGDDVHAQNTLDDPKRFAPVTKQVGGLGRSFTRDLPAHSVTILRLSTG